MAGGRKPGPMCYAEEPVTVDDGTMCLAPTPPPGPNGLWTSSQPSTAGDTIRIFSAAQPEWAAQSASVEQSGEFVPKDEINKAGLELIKSFESLRLAAYDDGVGVWTIGYGHTRGVKRGQKITEAEADAFLREDLRDAIKAVNSSVKVSLTDNQFAACVSLAFNIGGGNFKSSTLLRKLNERDYSGAAGEFAKWNKGGGKVLAGLTRRRAAEAELFNAP